MIRNETLDGWRGFLALWVVIGHIFLYSNVNIIVLTAPGYAVDGFIFLSGYFIQASLVGITKNFSSLNSIKVFYIYRFMRTWPIYCLILISYFLIWTLFSNAFRINQSILTGEEIRVFFLNLFLLNGFSPQYVSSTPIPSWSLSLEVQFYIIYPLVYFLKLYKSYFFIFFTFLLALIAPKILGNGNNAGLFAHFGHPSVLPFRLFHFMLGVVWFNNIRFPNYRFLIFCLMGMFAINAYTAMLILVIFFSNFAVFDRLNIFKSLILQFVGRISYSMYLIHFPILLASEFLFSKLHLDTNKLIFISIFTISVSVALSYISFGILEVKFISFGRKLAKDI